MKNEDRDILNRTQSRGFGDRHFTQNRRHGDCGALRAERRNVRAAGKGKPRRLRRYYAVFS